MILQHNNGMDIIVMNMNIVGNYKKTRNEDDSGKLKLNNWTSKKCGGRAGMYNVIKRSDLVCSTFSLYVTDVWIWEVHAHVHITCCS